jgi:hypothetical protein
LRLLVISDLHDDKYRDLLPLLADADVLLMPGDLSDAYRQTYGRALAFLLEASKVLPTFVGVGNHEMRLKDFSAYVQRVQGTGARFLFNAYERFGDLVIGCWYRPLKYGLRDILPEFQAEDGCRILLCHRPEDYFHHLRDTNADLVLSGHAHGGQIRLCGRGLFAPGQGIFPQYTKGIVDQRMIISAGVSNRVPIPRWNNPCEIVRVYLD